MIHIWLSQYEYVNLSLEEVVELKNNIQIALMRCVPAQSR